MARAPVSKTSFKRHGLCQLVSVGAISFVFSAISARGCAAPSHIVLTRSVAIPVAKIFEHLGSTLVRDPRNPMLDTG